jgi:hypothetical protein
MGYCDALCDATVDAQRDLLEAALVLGAHLDTPEGDLDDAHSHQTVRELVRRFGLSA